MNKLFTFLMLFISATAFCQLGGMSISPSGSAPDPSAGLDINFSNKGFLMPRVTQQQRDAISNPALGLQIYNNTNNCVEVYGFGNWQTISCLCSGAPSSPSTITGSNFPCANASNVTYTVGLVLGATTYTWTVPSDAVIIAGQGTNSITVNYGVNPGNVTVTANNSCGTSSPSVLPVTINTIPSAPGAITGADSVCSNTSGNVYSINTVAGATTYTWSIPGDAIVTSGQGTTSATITFGTTSGSVGVTSGNVCGNSSAASIIIVNTLVTHGSQTFYYNGNPQTFVVPGCTSQLTVAAYGAQGGNGTGSNGGWGGSATGSLPVTGGEVLYIFVGGQNGFNGGGAGGTNNYYGGGESDVRVGGTDISNWVIVAGGGGGGTNQGGVGGAGGGGYVCANGVGGAGGTSGGPAYGQPGGNGTCGSGGNAGSSSSGWSGGGGGGGLTSGGGGSTSGGYGANDATVGTLGQGGSYGYQNSNCSCGANGSGAGGGGGYYGGGGTSTACCAGGCGGGGSSWASGVMNNLSFSGGVQSGNGQVIITW